MQDGGGGGRGAVRGPLGRFSSGATRMLTESPYDWIPSCTGFYLFVFFVVLPGFRRRPTTCCTCAANHGVVRRAAFLTKNFAPPSSTARRARARNRMIHVFLSIGVMNIYEGSGVGGGGIRERERERNETKTNEAAAEEQHEREEEPVGGRGNSTTLNFQTGPRRCSIALPTVFQNKNTHTHTKKDK